MKEIIEGKIDYENKKYGFYYADNILTLIPDEKLEEVWRSMFKTLKERTVNGKLLLEGTTSSGHRIVFINVKLTKYPGGIYKTFVPAYIIGNNNMTNSLPKIDDFETMTFYGKCIDNLFNPQTGIEFQEDDSRNMKINLKTIASQNIKVKEDLFNFGVNTCLTRDKNKINTPVILESYLKVDFKSKKNIVEIVDYYIKISDIFKFLYSRKHIRFSKVKLASKGLVSIENGVKNITNTFDFYYYLPNEEELDLPDINDCVKYNQIEKYIEKIYITVNSKDVYKNYYNLNKEEEMKITINKYSNIASAFESWFDINFPDFKSDTNENYKILKNKVIGYIDDCIKEEKRVENKEILHIFKLCIEKLEGSLKEQIMYGLELFDNCIINLKKNLINKY